MSNFTRVQPPYVRSLFLAATTFADWSADVPTAIHASTAGNVIGQLEGDTVDRTFIVAAGVTYPYRFKEIDAATTSVILALYTQ